MKTAIVTGATGYIGRNLIASLIKHGFQIHAIVRPESDISILEKYQNKINFYYYDGSYESLAQAFHDTQETVTVFHLAAIATYQHSPADIAKIIQANITLGTQLLEAMQQHNCMQLINTGTYWQHNNTEQYDPVCLYAASKQAFEAIIDYYVYAHQFKVITLKLMDVYGPADPRPKLFTLLANTAKNNTPLDMSPGEQLLNLIYIDDVIDAYLLADKLLQTFTKPIQHKRYFVASEQLLPLKEIVAIYQTITNNKVTINWGKRLYREREVMHPWQGEKLPEWAAKINLENGIRKITNH